VKLKTKRTAGIIAADGILAVLWSLCPVASYFFFRINLRLRRFLLPIFLRRRGLNAIFPSLYFPASAPQTAAQSHEHPIMQ